MNLIELNKNSIVQLCQQHGVSRLYLFGSVLTPNFNNDSDIDLLIQFDLDKIDPTRYFSNYMDLKEKLEDLLNRSVDLVEDQAVRNPIFRKILDRDKKLIYERESA